MPEFALEGRDAPEFRALPDIVRGYIEAAFFTAPRPEESGHGVGDACPDCGATLGEGEDGAPFCPQWACGWSSGEVPESYGFPDLAPDALESMKADCAAFEEKARAALETVDGADWDGSGQWGAYDMEAAGRDLWFTRNGHGVGFWDRGFQGDAADAADRLADMARDMGESELYRGDDSRVYVS